MFCDIPFVTAKMDWPKQEMPKPRALFLKASIQNKSVTVLDRQHSSMLISFAKANALVYIPEHGVSLKRGALVEVLILPNTILT